MAKQAVLLLAHGTPETVEQIPEYLRNVVSGRPLPQHVIEEIQAPLFADRPQSADRDHAGAGTACGSGTRCWRASTRPVYVGMRNWRPYIPDVVRKMRADGVEEAAVICLAPQNSRTSVGLYERAVQAEAGALRIDFTEGWARHPLLAEAFAERLRAAEATAEAETGAPVPVLFTAHSVPYADGAAARAAGVNASRGCGRARAPILTRRRPGAPRSLWQSAFPRFRSGGLPSRARARAAVRGSGLPLKRRSTAIAAEGVKTLLLQPIGFLCDHVEILYDVDIAFKEYAAKLGVRLERPESLNASPTLARAVAGLAKCGLSRLQG